MSLSHLKSADLSDVGRKRKNNEDAVLSLPESAVFCVADGMGGMASGEVASQWTVEELARAFAAPPAGVARKEIVRQALNAASRRIKKMSEDKGMSGAGTTAVVLLFDPRQPAQALIMHAGDSRAYRIRNERLQLLTTDHSLAQAAGFKHERMLPSMFRGVVTRAVGLEETVEVEETPVDVQPGDIYLLCTDGLSKMVNDRKIQKVIRKAGADDPAALARVLVDEANAAGGEDNVSVVIVTVGPFDPAATMDEPATEAHTRETAAQSGRAAVAPAVPAFGPAPGAGTVADLDDLGAGDTPVTGHDFPQRQTGQTMLSGGGTMSAVTPASLSQMVQPPTLVTVPTAAAPVGGAAPVATPVAAPVVDPAAAPAIGAGSAATPTAAPAAVTATGTGELSGPPSPVAPAAATIADTQEKTAIAPFPTERRTAEHHSAPNARSGDNYYPPVVVKYVNPVDYRPLVKAVSFLIGVLAVVVMVAAWYANRVIQRPAVKDRPPARAAAITPTKGK